MSVVIKARLTLIAVFGVVITGSSIVHHYRLRHAVAPSHSLSLAVAKPLPSETTESMLRFLAARVRRDPDDYVACNMLAGYYLQRARETNDIDALQRAARAARASLASVPAVRNVGGLSALTHVEFAMHDFLSARAHALRLTQLDAGASAPYAALGDALLELGEYKQAIGAYRTMAQLGGGVGTETRLARVAVLHGETQMAQHHFARALALALDQTVPPRESVAWCRWQLGETAYGAGDYQTAERCYQDALTTFPGYFRAHASLGRVRAAQGDLAGGIAEYEEAVRIIPDPAFVAALGDLYQLAGRSQEAKAQYALVEQIGKLNKVNGTLYNRSLAQFYADHNLKPEIAFASAVREYTVRRDIYGADIVAWTALKAGKIAEAQTAIKAALALGTEDARLLYHAGLIARAAGSKVAARDYLRRALALNPQFDPLQAAAARKALQEEQAAPGV